MLSALALLAIIRGGLSLLGARASGANRLLAIATIAVCICLIGPRTAIAQETSNTGLKLEIPSALSGGPDKWTSPEGISSTIQVMLLLTVLSLAPAIMLMTTSFIRILVVLGILRQALGTQNLPPSQVLTSAALFLSLLIMWPVWKQAYDNGIAPYTRHERSMEDSWAQGSKPIRDFMGNQILRCGNSADVWMFYKYLPQNTAAPKNFDDVPLVVLLPAYMLSELKTAFLIGFQIYLPFVILDLVIASVTIGMGMLMLPPVLISLPFKLLLFVLVDGWHLVIEMLMQSFQPLGHS